MEIEIAGSKGLVSNALVRVSFTRFNILRLIAERPQTVCDLARALRINKSAVHKHLTKLVEGQALRRVPSRSWVYYHLDRAGAELLAQLSAALPFVPDPGSAEPA